MKGNNISPLQRNSPVNNLEECEKYEECEECEKCHKYVSCKHIVCEECIGIL